MLRMPDGALFEECLASDSMHTSREEEREAVNFYELCLNLFRKATLMDQYYMLDSDMHVRMLHVLVAWHH